MKYVKEIVVPEAFVQKIDDLLHDEPDSAEKMFSDRESPIESGTAFDNGLQMDIRLCGIPTFEPDSSNLPWTEAILFSENGEELAVSDVQSEYFGEWSLEYEGDTYVTRVRREGEKRCPKCYGTQFLVTPHITQTWIVDGYGNFEDVFSDFGEVTHKPDDEDIWQCDDCGYDAAGKEFNA